MYFFGGMVMRILFTTFLLVLAYTCEAKSIFINDSIDERILHLHELPHLIDLTNQYSFNQIRVKGFGFDPGYISRDYNTEATYWVKLKIQHNPNSAKEWILEFYDQTIDSITVFIPQKDGRYQEITLGDMQIFENRKYLHKNFEVPINNQLSGIHTYYFKIRSHTFADIRIAVRSMERFINYALLEYYLFGLFYGMILIIALYNLFIYFAIGEKKYLYYIFYIISVAVYAAAVDGIGFQYFWPDLPGWNQVAHGVAFYSVVCWAIVFGIRFLNLIKSSPRYRKFLQYYLIIRSGIFFYALILDNKLFNLWEIDILSFLLIFYIGLKVLLRGYKPARFFVLAYGALSLGFIIKVLVYSGYFPFSILSHYALHLGFLIEMILLSLALSDRIRIIKNLRDHAMKRIIQQHELNALLKDQVNQELERKVLNRTRELNNKNALLEENFQKLEEQAEEINIMNSRLDREVWQLKTEAREKIKDRLMNKYLSYSDFKQAFPDRISCYRYLENLKWKDSGFHCRKCRNEKFSAGQLKFSRRCTRCGHLESVTAYTIYHGLKFPIEKAYYITHLTLMNRKDITLKELSDSMDLRLATIWNFKHKLETRINQESGGKNNLSRHDWKKIILKENTVKSPVSH